MNFRRFLKDPIVMISIILVLIALLVLAGVLFLRESNVEIFIPTATTDSSQEDITTQGFEDSLPNCESDPNPSFSHEITDFSKVSYLTPPVTIQGNDSKTHGYIHLDFDSNENVPVYAPVDAKAYQGAFYDVAGSGPLYTFFFEVSCEVRFMFDHIANPVEKLKNEMPDSPAATSQGINFEPIQFKAGELVGYVGYTEGSKNWDLGVYNSTKENPHRNKQYEHSDTFRYSRAVCPYAYFSDELKEKYKKLFTDSYGNSYKSKTNLCVDI